MHLTLVKLIIEQQTDFRSDNCDIYDLDSPQTTGHMSSMLKGGQGYSHIMAYTDWQVMPTFQPAIGALF